MNTKSSTSSVPVDAIDFLEGLLGRKQTLGSFLLAIRKGEELTQEQFASLLKIPKQNLSEIENNRRQVSPGKAIAFAKMLGYPPDSFVRLVFQEMLDREGIKGVTVHIDQAMKKPNNFPKGAQLLLDTIEREVGMLKNDPRKLKSAVLDTIADQLLQLKKVVSAR
jgi:transcriptional regulator with XRE-family HTH domain